MIVSIYFIFYFFAVFHFSFCFEMIYLVLQGQAVIQVLLFCLFFYFLYISTTTKYTYWSSLRTYFDTFIFSGFYFYFYFLCFCFFEINSWHCGRYKLFIKYPQGLRLTFDRIKERLEDSDSSVVSCAVNVICELADKNPKNYLAMAPQFFRLLTTSSNNWMLIKVGVYRERGEGGGREDSS